MSRSGVIIIGAGGHAAVVADALLAAGQLVLGFVDNDPTRQGRIICGMPVLGNCRIPDDCMNWKPYPLFIAREAMRALVYDLTQAQGEST